jgi:hypothetical protein
MLYALGFRPCRIGSATNLIARPILFGRALLIVDRSNRQLQLAWLTKG